MRKDSAETAAANGLMQHLALSHPDVSFKFRKDGADALHTPGDGRLLSAIYAVRGRDFARSLLPVKGGGDGVAVSGFVTRPLQGRGSRSMQVFFVNGRFIKSQLLTAASGVSQNLLQDFLGMKLDARSSMRAARLTIAAIAAIGVVLAWNPDSSVFTIVSFAWAGFGASFGPVMLFALFWKRSNFQGALAGMISGGVMVFVWKYLVRPLGGAWNIYELLPAFLAASAAIVIVSLATAPPSQEIVREFDSIG